MFFALLKIAVKITLWFFLKRIDVRKREHFPATGPALIAINHPNNLLDTLIVAGTFSSQIHFLGTGALFRNPLLGWFLRKAGIIPVYRPDDAANHKERNQQTFQACYDALEHNKILGIYPEGTTHADWQVKKIKTGAARILLEAEKRNNFQLGVKLIPVGLNFSSRRKFRTSVIVSVGVPINTELYFSGYAAGDFQAVEDLTAELQAGIENEVKHLSESSFQEFVAKLDFFYREDMIRSLTEEKHIEKSEIDKLRLSKKLIEGVEYYAKKQPEIIKAIWDKIENYHRKLRQAHLTDMQIRRDVDRNIKPLRYVRIGFVGSLGLPIFFWGVLNNYLPNFFPARFGRTRARKETDIATIKVTTGLLVFPLFYALQTSVVFYLFGIVPAIVYFATLPFSGLFVLSFRKFYKRYVANVRLGLLLMKHRGFVERLKAQRARIVEELDELSGEFLAKKQRHADKPEVMPI